MKIGSRRISATCRIRCKFHLRRCHLLLLESNHDLEMLKVGPYPWSVKQRVMGRMGHLSNDVVCDFIARRISTATVRR